MLNLSDESNHPKRAPFDNVAARRASAWAPSGGRQKRNVQRCTERDRKNEMHMRGEEKGLWQPEAPSPPFLCDTPPHTPPNPPQKTHKPIHDECSRPHPAGHAHLTHTAKWHLNFMNIPVIKSYYRPSAKSVAVQNLTPQWKLLSYSIIFL